MPKSYARKLKDQLGIDPVMAGYVMHRVEVGAPDYIFKALVPFGAIKQKRRGAFRSHATRAGGYVTPPDHYWLPRYLEVIARRYGLGSRTVELAKQLSANPKKRGTLETLLDADPECIDRSIESAMAGRRPTWLKFLIDFAAGVP